MATTGLLVATHEFGMKRRDASNESIKVGFVRKKGGAYVKCPRDLTKPTTGNHANSGGVQQFHRIYCIRGNVILFGFADKSFWKVDSWKEI